MTKGEVNVLIIFPSDPGSYSQSPRSFGNKLLGVPKRMRKRERKKEKGKNKRRSFW